MARWYSEVLLATKRVSYAAGGAHDDASNADPRDVTSSDKLSPSIRRLIWRSTS